MAKTIEQKLLHHELLMGQLMRCSLATNAALLALAFDLPKEQRNSLIPKLEEALKAHAKFDEMWEDYFRDE